jgi:hypothetical protein
MIVLAIIGIPLVYMVRNRARKAALKTAQPANYSQKINTNEEPPADSV